MLVIEFRMYIIWIILSDILHFCRVIQSSWNKDADPRILEVSLWYNSVLSTQLSWSYKTSLVTDISYLKQHDTFNTSVLPSAKCCQVTSLWIERTDNHVLLMASRCLRSLLLTALVTIEYKHNAWHILSLKTLHWMSARLLMKIYHCYGTFLWYTPFRITVNFLCNWPH